ncbi:hypothetical protein [Macrococcus carouselicus]|uniref:Uncharacterized protein n=1 Tax=Macrococcus carouselicus TaxID=69969 RepID=A0A9Q8CR49_9STAP|nr:hypothetical protein [Macrococcus carouselicus]TDM04695.1 hypothetical protein ERX40_05915 [Macrococcus carouselicus]
MFKNLKQMQDSLDDVLNKNYKTFVKDKKNENPLIKTYIFENHSVQNEANKKDEITKILRGIEFEKNTSTQIIETIDENMVILTIFGVEYYFDISNSRFWKMHSLDYAKNTDRVQNTLLQQREMDNIWLPSAFMYSTENRLGELYSLGISFKDILKEEKNSNIERFLNETNDLNLHLSKKMAKPIIKSLLNENFKRELSIKTIGLLTSDENDEFIVDTLKYNGKFTARGNSFSMHINNVNNILDNYMGKISVLENDYPLQLKGKKIDGNFLVIKLASEVNIDKFIEKMCDGTKPFRLWATPYKIRENVVRIKAIDTHMGNYSKRLNININTSKKTLIIELLPESCGNSIARLITNINLFVDASANLTVGDKQHEYFRY